MYENNANNKSQIIVGKYITLEPYLDNQYILHLWFGEEEYIPYDKIEDRSNLNHCKIYIQPETAGLDELQEEWDYGCLVAVKGEAYSVLDRRFGGIRYGITPSYVCVVTEEVDDTFQHIIPPVMPEPKTRTPEMRMPKIRQPREMRR